MSIQFYHQVNASVDDYLISRQLRSAPIAQLVERGTFNLVASGSSPDGGAVVFLFLAAGEPRWGCKAFRFLRPSFLRHASPDGGAKRCFLFPGMLAKGSMQHGGRREEAVAEFVLTWPRAKQQKRSTGPSRVVPHRSTTPARTSLTSLFGWEAVSLVDMAALTGVAQHCNIYTIMSNDAMFSAISQQCWQRVGQDVVKAPPSHQGYCGLPCRVENRVEAPNARKVTQAELWAFFLINTRSGAGWA